MEEYIVVLSPKRWEVSGTKGSRRRDNMGSQGSRPSNIYIEIISN